MQRWFQAVVTHPAGVEGGAGSEEAQRLIRLKRGELEAVIRRSKNLTAAERLAIYANAYYARLLECLAAYFPVLQSALGEDVFESFAFEYLQHYPSEQLHPRPPGGQLRPLPRRDPARPQGGERSRGGLAGRTS